MKQSGIRRSPFAGVGGLIGGFRGVDFNLCKKSNGRLGIAYCMLGVQI
jgi:hypothetical protein